MKTQTTNHKFKYVLHVNENLALDGVQDFELGHTTANNGEKMYVTAFGISNRIHAEHPKLDSYEALVYRVNNKTGVYEIYGKYVSKKVWVLNNTMWYMHNNIIPIK